MKSTSLRHAYQLPSGHLQQFANIYIFPNLTMIHNSISIQKKKKKNKRTNKTVCFTTSSSVCGCLEHYIFEHSKTWPGSLCFEQNIHFGTLTSLNAHGFPIGQSPSSMVMCYTYKKRLRIITGSLLRVELQFLPACIHLSTSLFIYISL